MKKKKKKKNFYFIFIIYIWKKIKNLAQEKRSISLIQTSNVKKKIKTGW